MNSQFSFNTMAYGEDLKYGFAEYFLISILVLLLSVITYGLFLYFNKYKHMIEITSNIPSAPTWPIIGHGFHFIGVPAYKMLQRIWNMGENMNFGKDVKCLKIWLGPELNIITGDFKDIEIVLGGSMHSEKAGEYKVLQPWLMDGLLLSHGHKWFQRRKLITGAFHFQILPQFIDSFETQSRVMLTGLENERRKQEHKVIELYEFISLCTLDVICGKHYIFYTRDVIYQCMDTIRCFLRLNIDKYR